MARTKKYKLSYHYKREIPPDPISENQIDRMNQIIQIIKQRLIRHGKKKLAFRILQKSLKNIRNRTQLDPFLVLEKALYYTIPSVKLQTRRMGGTVYPIPVELRFEHGVLKALQWILSAAKKRSGPTLDVNLANELIDASKKAGTAFHKKKEIHRIAEANGGVGDIK